MNTPQVKSIRALARGLEVLHLLQSEGPLTLAQLHQRSALPKATLLRILKTLMEQGTTWQRMADSAYVASFTLTQLAARLDRESELVEAASPVLARLSEQVQWPSVLAVPRLTHMEVLETNASRTHISDIPLGPVGFVIPILRSASGRAWLSACEDPVRETTLDRLRRSDHPGDRMAHAPDLIARLLAETRAQGYALRDPDFGGSFDAARAQSDDKRDSLAVAIRLGSHCPGAINITWTKRAFTRDKAVAAFAEAVMQAARDIGGRLSG